MSSNHKNLIALQQNAEIRFRANPVGPIPLDVNRTGERSMHASVQPAVSQALVVNGAPLVLISGDELASLMGYDGVTGRFRAWCRELGIKAVPGRTNVYDPKHVRERLDAAQGMANSPQTVAGASPEPVQLSLVEKRRARLGKRQ